MWVFASPDGGASDHAVVAAVRLVAGQVRGDIALLPQFRRTGIANILGVPGPLQSAVAALMTSAGG